MRKVIRIDDNGYFVEDVLIEDDALCPDECIEDTTGLEGLYLPKWDVFTWTEGKAQSEIDAIKKEPPTKTDVEVLQDDLAGQNQMLSDFMDYIFKAFPTIS